MLSDSRQFAQALAAATLIAVFAIPQNLVAQATEHLVSPSELTRATVDASRARQQNLDTLNQFLSSQQAQQAMQTAHINPQQVKEAVAGLSDADLAQLASRATKSQADFAAGTISNRDLLIILVGIAALILIIVAVH
jgi:hypothetical protein